MNYSGFNDSELMDSYQTQMDYSRKADTAILAEIEKRGGLNALREKLIVLEEQKDELRRVRGLAVQLHHEGFYPEEMIQQISSDKLTEAQIRDLCEETVVVYKEGVRNTRISRRTIVGCIIGMLISSLAEAAIWVATIRETGRIIFLIFALTVPLSYIVIWLLTRQTRQTRQNVLVYVSTFLATALGFVFALLFVRMSL